MNLRNLPGAACAVAAAAVLLSACTPSSSSIDASASPEPSSSATVAAEAPEGTIDACDLISSERLTEITGQEIAAGVFNGGHSDSGRNVCDWRPVDEERTTPRVTITLNWGFPDAAEHRALAEEILGEGEDEEFEGATNAYSLPGKRTWGANVGDYFLKVSYIQPSNSDGAKVAKAITRDTIAALNEELGLTPTE